MFRGVLMPKEDLNVSIICAWSIMQNTIAGQRKF
jgi:hypothetical protein